MIGRGNRSTRRKPAPVTLCPPQTPHAARTRTRVAAVGSQRLTAELRHGHLSKHRKVTFITIKCYLQPVPKFRHYSVSLKSTLLRYSSTQWPTLSVRTASRKCYCVPYGTICVKVEFRYVQSWVTREASVATRLECTMDVLV
jgi:hypothetical protein